MASQEPVITVHNLRKDFILPQHKNTSIKQTVVNITRNNGKATQRVLDGISFDVNKGDFFGIVGRNGSGKSTLLKILAGVYTPTSGDVEIRGGLTPFIELGVGFNPELSGRDNVFLNGALLGFSRKEMAAMYDEIVDFAELEPFMDQKLKNYSSGMQVRLAFSIAIKAHNEILIFDEVLAVGDEAFQRKCLDVFEQYKASKQTVILVTHDMETVKKFCNRAILLNQGKIIRDGNPYKIANEYSKLNQAEIDREVGNQNTNRANAPLLIKVTGVKGEPKQSFAVGETLMASVSWSGLDDIESVGINIFKESGEHITGFNSRFMKNQKDWRLNKQLRLGIELNIRTGKYFLLVEAFKREGIVEAAVLNGPHFSVVASDDSGLRWSGLTNLPHRWL